MSHKHITPEQRNELAVLKRVGVLQKDIAKLLNKTPSAISQEIAKNKGGDGKYRARSAKQKTIKRRLLANARFKKLENNPWLVNYIIRKLKLYWSPEQIAGRLKLDYPEDKKRQIRKDTIYKFIYFERKDLVKYLRCKKGKYRRRYGTRIREKEREKAKKKRIDVRPCIVEKRSRVGDWEGDTIVGSDNSHILTHVERRSGILFADKLKRGTADFTRNKTIKRFRGLPRTKRHTITYDNGATFSDHREIEKSLGLDVYFAFPYHSWERGCNENCNGLLRQFFPKKSSFREVRQKDIEKVVKLINNRPRKRLNYLMPVEVFYEKRIVSR